MGTTPNYAWPYPELGDAPHGPDQVKALADAVDTDVKVIDDRVTTAEADIATLEDPPSGSVSKNVDQSIPNGVLTKVTFQVADHAYGDITTDLTNNQLVTNVKGLYTLIFTERWAASGEADSMRTARIRVNGIDIAQASGQNQNSQEGSTTLAASRTWLCDVGDVIEAYAFQNSGAGVSLTTNYGGTFLSADLIRRVA